MPRACCVPYCTSSTRKVRSHSFPRNENRREQWLECLHITASETEIQKLQVCSKHFHATDYKDNQRNLLITAIPSINIPTNSQNEQEIELQNIKEGQNVAEQNRQEQEELNEHDQVMIRRNKKLRRKIIRNRNRKEKEIKQSLDYMTSLMRLITKHIKTIKTMQKTIIEKINKIDNLHKENRTNYVRPRIKKYRLQIKIKELSTIISRLKERNQYLMKVLYRQKQNYK